jgi:hypothetical protein
VATAFWTNDFHLPTESYPYPTNNWISAALGNPVNDGEGSITTNGGAQHSAYNGDDLVTESKLFAPVVIGRAGQTFFINHGEVRVGGVSTFAYPIPCGYKPLSDLAADDTSTTNGGVVNANCWTVGGVCNAFATSAPSRHHSKAAPFLEQAQKDAFAFGGTKGEQSLEDRIGTTKYYSQKRGGD